MNVMLAGCSSVGDTPMEKLPSSQLKKSTLRDVDMVYRKPDKQ